MDNPRPEKVAVVDEVRGKLSEADAVMLAEYRGLNVTEMAELRRAMRPDGEFKVYKNTLVRFAVDELDMEIADLLSGPTAIAFVRSPEEGKRGDTVSVAKALAEFAKTHPQLVIKGGLLGDERIEAEDIDKLSKVAPREELLARLAGGLAAPMQKFAGLLQAMPQNFAYLLQALIEAGGGPDAAAPAEAPASESATDDAPADAEAPVEAPDSENATDDGAVSEAGDTAEASATDSAPEPESDSTADETPAAEDTNEDPKEG